MKTLMKYNIKYAKRKSEFEIQSDLYQLLKTNGYNVRGEVSCFASENRVTKKMRFDLVVFDKDNAPLLIIEVKRAMFFNYSHKEKRQQTKYENTNIPVLYAFSDYCLSDILYSIKIVEHATTV